MQIVPAQFDIKFEEFDKTNSYVNPHVRLTWNGRQIGNELNDNSYREDGFRYHDVFHFGCYALLGCSYVTQALFDIENDEKHEPSRAQKDLENAEEAIGAIIFYDASRKNYYKDRFGVFKQHVDKDVLKNVKEIAADRLAIKESSKKWQETIANIYDVFRPLYKNRGGIVHCNAVDKKLIYRSE